ncbi:uncharacterized protein LOC131333750 isoform X2 [Rhododendron vialii]|uniref:uncharacterized protein LOC131333750 isoform X2 n=1 Tax=Rhododendron vialii TaxID=182163 RepID=UPI00266015A1|nr:uncharacterized protein LOC131333750 isoform X2 [Rhododendron vialii]
MKFLSSSSSSSTSPTAAAAFTTAGCLASMLRRLLCFNVLPTHPANQIKDIDFNSAEFDKLGCLETEEKIGDTDNPGIVARLMGLELTPRFDFSNAQMKPSSTTRSQSMDCDSSRESGFVQGQHRRAKTSLSSHEMPTFFEHEEFFVLSFENLGKDNESRSKGGTLKPRKAGKCRRRRRKSESDRRESVAGEEDKENQEHNKRANHKVSQTGILSPAAIFNQNSETAREAVDVVEEKAETESNSENSSPVSVLDFCESIFHPLVPTSEDANCKGSNSRRKLSTELENHEHSSPPSEPSSSTNDIRIRNMIHRKCYGSMQNDCQREKYVKIWSEICKIAEAEMVESNWVKRAFWKLEDCSDISAECELHILQELLNEVVNQLVETSPENF